MPLNQAGIDLVKRFEGCKLNAYPDPGTGSQPWTIGYGHTGADVQPHTVWTQVQADAVLTNELDNVYETINSICGPNLAENQYAALTSLVYNIGVSNFRTSTLLMLLNKRAYSAAADCFLNWDHAGGKVMPGLLARRQAERELFLTV